MAKRKVNKAAAIRDYKKKHRKALPKEIAAALGKQGIKVTPGAVSTTLSSAKRKARGGKTLKRGGAKSSNGAVDANALKAAANLIKTSGGLDGARQALAAAEAVAKALNA